MDDQALGKKNRRDFFRHSAVVTGAVAIKQFPLGTVTLSAEQPSPAVGYEPESISKGRLNAKGDFSEMRCPFDAFQLKLLYKGEVLFLSQKHIPKIVITKENTLRLTWDFKP